MEQPKLTLNIRQSMSDACERIEAETKCKKAAPEKIEEALRYELREVTQALQKLEAKVLEANELLAIQAEDGNWDYSDYMLGMYNGMELVLSVIEGREPSYRSKKEGD